mgnify:FL=1
MIPGTPPHGSHFHVAIELVMVYCTIMSPAKLLYRAKRTTREGLIVEMVVWQLPEPTAERPHRLKYRLYCGRLDGTLVVRYDNETGKGDHRHYGDSESSYTLSILIR